MTPDDGNARNAPPSPLEDVIGRQASAQAGALARARKRIRFAFVPVTPPGPTDEVALRERSHLADGVWELPPGLPDDDFPGGTSPAETSKGAAAQVADMGYVLDPGEVRARIEAGKGLPLDPIVDSIVRAERAVEDIAVSGSPAPGWDSLARGDAFAAPTGAAGFEWEHKTPEEILADVDALLEAAFVPPDGLPDMILLPPAAFMVLAATWRMRESESLLDFVRRSNKAARSGTRTRIRPHPALKAAGGRGRGRAVAFHRDEDKLAVHLPVHHDFASPRMDADGRIVVPGRLVVGGLRIKERAAVARMDGIS